MAYTTPEQKVQQKIIKYFKQLKAAGYPIEYFRREAGTPCYKKGSSDLYFIWGPYHVEVEIKAPNGELSAMQEKWYNRMTSLGTPCLIIDNLEYLQDMINTYFIQKKIA